MEPILSGLVFAAACVAATLWALALASRRKRGDALPRDFDFTHYKRIEHK